MFLYELCRAIEFLLGVIPLVELGREAFSLLTSSYTGYCPATAASDVIAVRTCVVRTSYYTYSVIWM